MLSIFWPSQIFLFNPLTPKSDLHLISSYNITPEAHMKVTRIKEMISSLKKLLIFKQVLLVSKLKMCREQFGEYAYWC